MKPIVVLPWFLNPDPPTVWNLQNRLDLIACFNACARNAAVFAFISVAVFRRDRFLLNREAMQRAVGTGIPHLWGMMEFLRNPLRLHYIPEALIRNRMSDLHANSYANTDLYGRWMQDLRAWTQVADDVFGDDPEVNDAFCRILGRNHHNTHLPGLRQCAPTENDWPQAVPYLVRAGFPPVQFAAVDLAHQHLNGGRLPMPTLDPAGLCLADLPIVTRGARHIAVLALGGPPNIVDGAGLLAALRHQLGEGKVRVFCTSDCAELLDGFEVQCVDPGRYAREVAYRESLARAMADYAPELAVNLDPEQGLEGDDLLGATVPAGAVAFVLPKRGQEAPLAKAVNAGYTRFITREAGAESMRAALDLKAEAPALWPSPVTQREAQAVLGRLGWDPAFRAALAEAAGAGWTLVGLGGGRGTYGPLEALLEPWEGRAANLAGVLNLGSTVGLLPLCGGYLGGTPLQRAVAGACGCAPWTVQAAPGNLG